MNYTNTIFNQLLDLLPRNRFDQFVGQHKADKYIKKMSCWNQFSIMLYAQAKGKESLREIETSLNVQGNKLYHLGLRSIAKSTIAEANMKRPYQIYESLFYELLKLCKTLTPNKSFDFNNPLKALDSTTITLCLKLFPWAKFSKTKGAIKLHCLFDIRDQIPEFIVHSEGRANDLAVAKKSNIVFSPDSINVFDRAYIDFKWLYDEIHKKKAYFVHRLKTNIKYHLMENYNVNEKGVISDQRMVLMGCDTLENYPEDVRLVTYYDEETNKTYQFFTNNFDLSAATIAEIYKARWQIELFFKWIKQHLKIKTFFGTSKNAVLTQIWIAMIYYLLLSYIKKKTRFKASLLKLTWVLAEVLMDRAPLIDILDLKPNQLYRIRIRDDTQMSLL